MLCAVFQDVTIMAAQRQICPVKNYLDDGHEMDHAVTVAIVIPHPSGIKGLFVRIWFQCATFLPEPGSCP